MNQRRLRLSQEEPFLELALLMALIKLVCRAVGSVFQRNGQLERLGDSLMFEREVTSLAAVHRRSGFHIWKGLLLPEHVLASAARRPSG